QPAPQRLSAVAADPRAGIAGGLRSRRAGDGDWQPRRHDRRPAGAVSPQRPIRRAAITDPGRATAAAERPERCRPHPRRVPAHPVPSSDAKGSRACEGVPRRLRVRGPHRARRASKGGSSEDHRLGQLLPGTAGVCGVPLPQVRKRLMANSRPRTTPLSLSRREVLKTASAGFGYLALTSLLGQEAARAATEKPTPLAPKAPHFRTKAKRIIFLFMEGAMSQMDTWEYKPHLQKNDGKVGPGGGTLVASKFKFRQHGKTGTWVSELYPNLAKHVDKLCFIRGLHTDTPAHPQAVIQLHTGTALAQLTRPSMGAWLLYGLGTENQDLPGYITINPP